VIDQKINDMSERRNQYIDRILLNHPLQPLNIKHLNMIVHENVESELQTASEIASEAVASEKVISESP
jgi:hypothetical protein